MQKDLPFNLTNRIVDNLSTIHKLLSPFYLKLLSSKNDNRMKSLKYEENKLVNENNTKKKGRIKSKSQGKQ